MTCDVIRDLLPLYADGLASQESCRLIEQHIAQCGECRHLLEQMRAPMEGVPEDRTLDYVKAIRKQKEKNRRRMILACVCTTLAILLGCWIYMETHFTTQTLESTSTDREKILSQLPELELTGGERALAGTIFQLPSVREYLTMGELRQIPLEKVGESLTNAIPPEAEGCQVSAGEITIWIEYHLNGVRTILEYIDGDGTGYTDLVRKVMAVSEEDAPTADEIYVLEWDTALDETSYEKLVSKHVWFGFLNMT